MDTEEEVIILSDDDDGRLEEESPEEDGNKKAANSGAPSTPDQPDSNLLRCQNSDGLASTASPATPTSSKKRKLSAEEGVVQRNKKAKLMEERRKVQQQAKEEKEKQKEERERQKEERRRLKDAKQKELEMKKEEKRKKEEERRQEEMERQKMKQKEAERRDIRNFFSSPVTVRPKTPKAVLGDGTAVLWLKPFELKCGMKLAPLRRVRSPSRLRQRLDAALGDSTVSTEEDLYLAQLNRNEIVPGCSGPTLISEAKDDDVLLVENDCRKNRPKMKLLQFRENRRPAYFGSWQWRSRAVRGRRPFGRVQEAVTVDGRSLTIDYDADSDDEWEEAEGDDCLSDDDQEDAENDGDGEDEDMEDGWLVEHGYLSDDEADQEAEDDEAGGDPETRRQQLAAKAEAWKAEKLSKVWKKLNPVVLGPVLAHLNPPVHLLDKLAPFMMLRPSVGSDVEPFPNRPLPLLPPSETPKIIN